LGGNEKLKTPEGRFIYGDRKTMVGTMKLIYADNGWSA
jgi:hypothetical protein